MTDQFPLGAAARSAARIWTAVGGIVTGLAGVGVITATGTSIDLASVSDLSAGLFSLGTNLRGRLSSGEVMGEDVAQLPGRCLGVDRPRGNAVVLAAAGQRGSIGIPRQ